ncbi:MAG: CPBP family intramembrane metalloprotease [Clostridia bacterium]|nr:CPBP family intramembrane metalloprotease [Clostridia bacterium]
MINQNEVRYKNLMTRIGASLLVFLGLITASQTAYRFFSIAFSEAFGERMGYVIGELLYGALYFASFALPVLFFCLISKGKEREPMHLSPRLTANTPLIIIASIGMILLCAMVNSLLIDPFISPEFDYDSVFLTSDYSEPYKVVLHFIVIAIVPGICEELLFRGMILGNLLPYGKTGAIVASAFLFGLMHQNPLQMFYTTMAGIILGLIYVYTESIWCSMLVHVLNNAFSVFLEWLSELLGESGEFLLYLLQGGLFVLSVGAIVWLLIRNKRFSKTPDFENGVFERTLPEVEGYCRIPVDSVRKIRLFFSPTVIVFLVLVLLQMGRVMLLLMGGAS